MSPNDGTRHDRTITQSDTPPPPSAAPVSGEAYAADPSGAFDEYGEALYDDEPLERVDDDEVAGSGWSMWDDDWHDPRHAPSSGATVTTGPPRSDAYRTGGAGAVRPSGPPTPSTGQGAAVGPRSTGARATGSRSAAAASAGSRTSAGLRGRRPQAVAGVVGLWVVCLIGGLVIGSAGGGDTPPDQLVTVEPDGAEGDWRDAAVPGGGPVTSLPSAGDDRPSQRPDRPQRPTTTARPDVTRPETTTTTEGEPDRDVTTTTTAPEEETTTTSSSTTTSTTEPQGTTTTTEAPPTTTTTAGANALRSFLPF